MRKPNGYWDDFTNIEREIRAFIVEQGIDGVMPSVYELAGAGRSSLTRAIGRHGGIPAVAEQLGLIYNRKSVGDWSDFANVKQELLAFIAEHGNYGIMPTVSELTNAGHSVLARAISQHGGFLIVAEQLGLERPNTDKPLRCWNDFTNVERELRTFIVEHGTEGIMPTSRELTSAGRADLARAIGKQGGFPAVAERLGLARPNASKPKGYWDTFTNVAMELRTFIADNGIDGVMPTKRELSFAGRTDLARAINEHGGMTAVAEQLGLKRSDLQKPAGYWNDFANIKRELHIFIVEHGTEGIMPTSRELASAERVDLVQAIGKQGGFPAVAERLGLNRPDADKLSGYWNDFTNFEKELRAFVAEYGIDDVMPTYTELVNARRHDLINAISKHGGIPAVAERLGLARPDARNLAGYWSNFTNVERELNTFIATHGVEGVMPTQIELKVAGRADLPNAIHKHGGFSAVARRLGLTSVYEYITPRTATSVERTARAIQPLAESNLLSAAQIMVILRRAGMLEFRNQRVVKLGASLARGDHEEIESALTNLVSGGEDIATETVVIEERDDLTAEEAAALLSGDLDAGPTAPPLKASTAPDVDRETAIIRGLSALGELRLPLDEVLSLLTSKVLWQEFYKRLYAWYGSLKTAQTVTAEDVEAAILAAYPEHTANDFVAEASALFTVEVEQAVNFAAALPDYSWQGPRLYLHQADAARRMAEVLGRGEASKIPEATAAGTTRPDAGPDAGGREDRPYGTFLLDADDPGLGKSASFLAAVALSDVRSVVIVAPKTVADDTWTSTNGEIRHCLPRARIVRGLDAMLKHADSPQLTFYVLHYEELLNEAKAAALAGRSFDCLCLDEIHFIKQRAGQDLTHRREALETLRAAARTAIGLTGTPLVNELAEPMSLLQTLSQHAPQFDHSRLSNRRLRDIADVFESLLPHVVRRRKTEVLLHLPQCDVRPVDIPLPADLSVRMLDIYAWPRSRASSALVELRKLATEAKLPHLQARAQVARKLLILTYLTDDVSDKIARYLEEFMPRQIAHINGATPKADRTALLNAFRTSDQLRVLVGTIGTIGVGLTLFDPGRADTAHEIIVADLPYTWAEFEQGIARLHREGQKQAVQVEVLQTTTSATLRDGSALHTLDERIWYLIESKRELSDVAIDGKYDTTDAAAKVQKALRRWLQQAREVGVEPLEVERRSDVQSEAQKWRGEIGRLRSLSAARADEVFADAEYTRQFLTHLETSQAAHLSHQWLRGKLALLIRPDLKIVDMGCGLNPFADLPCHIIGLDRHERPGQLRGKLENPPLPDRSADVLIYSLSLYGTPDDLFAYFTHASRILRGGGHLFIVEPAASFSDEGLKRFIVGVHAFGFELVGTAKELRGEDGTLLKALHLTLTGEIGQPSTASFERK
jgi:hypothetical protein